MAESILLQLFQAEKLIKQQKFAEAECLFLEIVTENDNEEEKKLNGLLNVALLNKELTKAVSYLENLISLRATNISYYDMLASCYAQLGYTDKAYFCYKKLIKFFPNQAHGYFNLGYYSKLNKKYLESIKFYLKAIELGINKPEEVYLNVAVIQAEFLRKENDAIQTLEKALLINPNYGAALYNLASLYEEVGNKVQATLYFEKVLKIEPNNYQVLARIAEIKIPVKVNDPLISKITSILIYKKCDQETQINLYYALAKLFDSSAQYEKAFEMFEKANLLEKCINEQYSKEAQEAITDRYIAFFSKKWFCNIINVSNDSPIFICGMFRSGSTLLEQLLATHPNIVAGGELNFFPDVVKKIQPFPDALQNFSYQEISNIAKQYVNELQTKFSTTNFVIDKRPDNFLLVGLVKTVFPKAKIIFTERNDLDNCLSVFFNRLDKKLNYSTDINAIAHYNNERKRLIKHWSALFPKTIYTVSYDELVKDPQQVLLSIYDFLGLELNTDYLNFYQLTNRVKTASIWQVRKPIYKTNSGKGECYKKYLSTEVLKILVPM